MKGTQLKTLYILKNFSKPKTIHLFLFSLIIISKILFSQERFYQNGAPWFSEIINKPLDPKSQEIISWIASKGGFGTGRIQIDFSFHVLEANNNSPFKSFQKNDAFYEGECHFMPVPVPANGAIEGETDYTCTGYPNGGDCHLIVYYTPWKRLYELYRAHLEGNTLHGGCLSVWDFGKPYSSLGQGEGCTSADAAGLPIAPLLFTADEVASGEIKHAIRFTLPNDRIQNRTYVKPATHATQAASGGTSALPYGGWLRLKSSFPVQNLTSKGAKVVATALQKYGMILADGGNIALMGQNDRFTNSKWSGLLGPLDLTSLKITDFEIIDGGTRYYWTGNCQLISVPQEIKVVDKYGRLAKLSSKKSPIYQKQIDLAGKRRSILLDETGITIRKFIYE